MDLLKTYLGPTVIIAFIAFLGVWATNRTNRATANISTGPLNYKTIQDDAAAAAERADKAATRADELQDRFDELWNEFRTFRDASQLDIAERDRKIEQRDLRLAAQGRDIRRLLQHINEGHGPPPPVLEGETYAN